MITKTENRLRVRGLWKGLEIIANAHHVLPSDILGSSRFAGIVAARHAFWHSLRCQGRSYLEIAWLLDRNHTSIMHGCKKIESKSKDAA